MIKMKTGLLALVTILFASSTMAQSLEDGKKFLYYERFKSAKEVFLKLTAANANDESANYYLGQSMIGLEDVAGAKAFYLQKISAAPNSPLILAGIGQVELIEGKISDAKSRFETAINLSGGKRIDVLNAVGVANSNPDMKNGDAAYAVDKLTLATTLKGFKDPDVLVNLGNAYRKMGDGGNASKSYDAASALSPTYARGVYRKGRLYQSQGASQEALFIRLYSEAIAIDSKFAPVYNTLFNYYYQTNVTKSADYLEKYLGVSDVDGSTCYKRASMKFAQKLFAEAISKSDECIAEGGATPYPNLYGLKAYSYSLMNDSVNAKKFFEEYFARQAPARIGAGDYKTYAGVLLRFPGNEMQAGEAMDKAIALDTLEEEKVSSLKIMANNYKAKGNLLEAANWFNKILYIKKNYGVGDLYNAGYNYYKVNKYDSSIAVFTKYSAKYPDDMFGNYMIAKNIAAGSDSLMTKGTAAAAYTKAIEIGERAPDKTKVKDYLIGAYTFMLQYSFNIKKDQATAISYADKALALDPADAQLIKSKEFVTKNNPAATRPTTPARPAATAPKPGTATPKPGVTAPKPAATAPKPAATAPKPVVKPAPKR
jgi:tetratricopeptide (TPR) repeat protein